LKKIVWFLDDTTVLHRKTKGSGIMGNMLICREFEIGLGVNEHALNESFLKANQLRQREKYINKEAATQVTGREQKKTVLMTLS